MELTSDNKYSGGSVHPPQKGGINDAEAWRPVEGWPYEVSSLGRVRRRGPRKNWKSKEFVSTYKNKRNGYLFVILSAGPRRLTKNVHKLVAEAFLGLPPPGYRVNHIDSNPSNPALSNLEYLTQSDNIRHAVKKGRFPVGSRRWNSKLTDKAVQEILSSAHNWKTVKSLAAKFGVTPPTILKVINRENWKTIMNDAITTQLRCFDCGHEWSDPRNDEAIPRCPKCGSDDVLDPVTSDLEPNSLTQD